MGSSISCCDRNASSKEEELKISTYTQIKITIGSYTSGIKTRLKEVMTQASVGGYIRKTIYAVADNIHSTPIHTEVVAGGTASAINEFTEIAKEIVEDNIDFEITPYPIPELEPEEKQKVIIKKTNKRIANRKSSDVGDDNTGDDDLLGKAVLVTNKVKNRAKQVLNVVSGIPILAEYTSELKEQWSLLIKEMPKELVTAKSLFHPYTVSSFFMYSTDELGVLKVCIEWKMGIPYESIELFTMSGVPLTDTYTLLKDKQCVFVDNRVTKKFFDMQEELKEGIQKITQEPFVFHMMALHGMTKDYLVSTFGKMDEKMAQETIKGDLCVSGVVAIRILKFIKEGKTS